MIVCCIASTPACVPPDPDIRTFLRPYLYSSFILCTSPTRNGEREVKKRALLVPLSLHHVLSSVGVGALAYCTPPSVCQRHSLTLQPTALLPCHALEGCYPVLTFHAPARARPSVNTLLMQFHSSSGCPGCHDMPACPNPAPRSLVAVFVLNVQCIQVPFLRVTRDLQHPSFYTEASACDHGRREATSLSPFSHACPLPPPS